VNLSQHFSLQELTASEYAIRHGLDNHPTDPDVLDNLHTLAAGLEGVRSLLGEPVYVSSGYRSGKVNSGIGGSKASSHMEGLAADFTCPAFGTPREICECLNENKERIGFEQLILEFDSWCHIAFPPIGESPAKLTMTAKMVNGKVHYLTGLV